MSAPDLTPQGGDVSPTDAGQDAPTHGHMPGALA